MASAEYQKRRWDKHMSYCKEKLGNKCVDCGATDALQFDHVSLPRLYTISEMGNYSRNVVDTELAKCVLRCVSCHSKRHHGSAKGTHGTLSSYRYCKCAFCRKAASDWNREYKRRRRQLARQWEQVPT